MCETTVTIEKGANRSAGAVTPAQLITGSIEWSPVRMAGATFLRTPALQVSLVVVGGWLFGFVGLLCALVLTEGRRGESL